MKGAGMAERSFFTKWSDVIRRMPMATTVVCSQCDGLGENGGTLQDGSSQTDKCQNCDGRGYSPRTA